MSDTNNPTTKQQEILQLLYRFRFLNRPQIQSLLNHKQHSRIIAWLNTLTQNEYLKSYPDKQFAASPTVYSLGNNGRKYLKSNNLDKSIDIKLLNRIWRENSYSPVFREHCLTIADINLSLLKFAAANQSTLNFHTRTDLHRIQNLITPLPDAYFTLKDKSGKVKRYFLEAFGDLPSGALRRRIRQYFDYFESDDWQFHTGKSFPEIILVCHSKKQKGFLYHYIQFRLREQPDMNFYLSTKDQIKSKGICKEVLQKVTEEE
jgi:hypothetical protein